MVVGWWGGLKEMCRVGSDALNFEHHRSLGLFLGSELESFMHKRPIYLCIQLIRTRICGRYVAVTVAKHT